MFSEQITFHEKDALLYRLHDGLEGSNKDIVFVVGAPLTAPFNGDRGVADVNAVVDLIRSEFATKPIQLDKLNTELAGAANPYQSAFDFLSGRAGQDAANRIIKRAVSQALLPTRQNEWIDTICGLSDDQLRALYLDPKIWHLNAAVSSLGSLIAKYPERFGQIVITSNFDPLLEISITQGGGTAWRTSLSDDGSIFQSTALGCQVIHIHGYWYGTDTLHTNRQLVKNRPALKNDLLRLLENKIVVVVAYGGWPDILTGVLNNVTRNGNIFPEILWACHGQQPTLSEYLYSTLKPGIDRNRVTFYKGIDCHEFFPELLYLWENRDAHKDGHKNSDSPRVLGFTPRNRDRERLFRLPILECDRPPNIEVWVGRENELRALEASNAKVVIICGIGGEGKSVLASHYISTLGEREGRYQLWDWRDCKEQSDRIRTQIVEIIARFSAGEISSDNLKEAEESELVEVLVDQTNDANAVLVLDNVDSYVDLENRTFIGILDTLIQRLSLTKSSSRLILTCRPDVQYNASSVITFSMKGLSGDEAAELFSKRAPGQNIPAEDIREAHLLTKGHAFWLDLIAVQVTKVPGTTLRKLLDDLRRGREEVPDVLSSIWSKLPEREQTLLRFMAEAVRPETEKTIEKFVVSKLGYHKFQRALKSLISLNLIVVKPELNAPDLYDLHPLVRQFVRTKFERSERSGFIRIVINQYEIIIGAIESLLGANLPFPMLERWSQKAELEVAAGFYDEAFETLVKVEDALIGGGHIQEFVRVGRLLFEAIDWETAATKYKEFDRVVGVMVPAFDQLGDVESADSLLIRYEDTIPQKTVRYIKFCDVKAYSFWLRGNFDAAIEWGLKGDTLKSETNVDTAFDCRHNLALAQRDAGNPEIALEYFRKGLEISDIVAGAEGVPVDGALYGNVGRCLQLMRRSDEALACYRRSMAILERDSSSVTKSNRAYARRWVGQIFAGAGNIMEAEAFLMDSIRLLGTSAPIRVRELYSEVENIRGNSALVMEEGKVMRIVSNWMRG